MKCRSCNFNHGADVAPAPSEGGGARDRTSVSGNGLTATPTLPHGADVAPAPGGARDGTSASGDGLAASTTGSEPTELKDLASERRDTFDAFRARLAACPRLNPQCLLDEAAASPDIDRFIRLAEPLVVSLEALSDTSDLAEWTASWQ